MATHVEKMRSKKLLKLLEQHQSLTVNAEKGKIKCSLTGHEMPCKEEAINTYIRGKKFKKAFARDSNNYEKYKPHIVPSTKKFHENHLFCMLTLRHINKTPQHVERHVNGKRYKKALARWKVCQEKDIKFVPNRRKREKTEAGDSDKDDGPSDLDTGVVDPTEDEGDGEEDTSDEEDMEDLYPAEDFMEDVTAEKENTDSDYEFDDDNFKNDTGSKALTDSQGKVKNKTKRKNKESKPSKKKQQKVG